MRYCVSSSTGASPWRTSRSNTDRSMPAFFTGSEMITGASCLWSPTSTTRSAPCTTGTSASGSVLCETSSISTVLNSLSASSEQPAVSHVHTTTSAPSSTSSFFCFMAR